MNPRFAALSLSLMIVATHSPAKEASATQAPALPENKARVLAYENGLTLIVEEDHSAPVASVQAWCGTGSIHEGRQMGAGLSHILEHMLFKGTTTRGGGDIARQIQSQGGYINAYTSFDRTVYWIDVPATGVTEAVAILADAMQNSTLPEGEYAKEQEVIRREFAMGFDDPDRQSSQLMLNTVFGVSPFRHPVIGYLDIYNKLTREDVLAYYRARYVPNNLTFVISGDVDAAALQAQLGELFKDAPRRALEPVYIATEPEQVGRRDAEKEFPTELTRAALAWRVPGLTNPDTPALDLLGDVLGSGRSAILNQVLREEKKIVHSVDAGMFSLQSEGVFVVDAVCDPDQSKAFETGALSLIANVKKNGVSQADIDKARRRMLKRELSTLATARGRASDLGGNWLLTKNLNFTKDYLDAVARVTAADLQRVARTYLRDDRLNVSVLNPIGMPSATAQAQAPAAGASEIRKFTLSNGLRLLVRENPRLPLVSIHATFRSGLLAETPETNGITKLLSKAILKGTKTRSAAKIAGEIETAGGSIGSDAGNNSFSVAVEVMKPDLDLGISLLADVLENPAFPAAEVELEKNAQIAAIKAEEEQITAVARNATRKGLFGTHPYGLRANGTPASVAGLTPGLLRAFHDEYIVANNGVIAVFGAVNAGEVRKLVEKELGTLPAGKLALSNPPLPAPLAETVQVVENRDKKQAVLMIGYPGVDVLNPDRTALELINEASNDLSSRFFDRIREKLGLAYFVGAGAFTGISPGSFVFYLGTDPAKVDKVRIEFNDEISKLAADGLTPEELARAKKKLLGSEAIRNQSNSSFAATVAADELLGLGFDNALKRNAQVEAVTIDDARRVANKYLQVPARVEVTVTPATTSPAVPPATPATPAAN